MIKGYNGSLYGTHRQNKFSDVYSDAESFLNDYKNIGLPPTIKDENINTLFYLLYSNYGNSTIAASDLTRFKYKLFSIIWQYGPTWEKRLNIQEKLRALTDEEIESGNINISNQADNPSVTPTTESSEYLQFIKNQYTSISKRGKLEAYGYLLSLLDTDVTQQFIDLFKKLFLVIVEPEQVLLYPNIGDDEE